MLDDLDAGDGFHHVPHVDRPGPVRHISGPELHHELGGLSVGQEVMARLDALTQRDVITIVLLLIVQIISVLWSI